MFRKSPRRSAADPGRRSVLGALGSAAVGIGLGSLGVHAAAETLPGELPPGLPDASRRGSIYYEDWRRSMIWQRRKAKRFPDLIVQASSVEDVVAAVRFARRQGLRVATRCGGHNMSACFLRDRGLLLDVSRLRDVAVDAARREVVAGPGVLARALNERLRADGLAFPTAHCGMVPLGGFLLGGGLGLNGNRWGAMSAFNIESAEVVTADGEIRTASATENPDLFWALRGAGPGLFLVVTRLRLRAYELPAAIVGNSLAFPFSDLVQIAAALTEIGPRTPLDVELLGYGGAAPEELLPKLSPADDGRAVYLHANAYAGSLAQAQRMCEPLLQHPIARRALWQQTGQRQTLEELYSEEELGFPQRRWNGDNIFTNRLPEVAKTVLERIAHCPSRDAQVVFHYKGSPALPDAACSTMGDFYSSFYSLWDDPADDARNQEFLTGLYRDLAPLGVGSNINEMNQEGRSEDISQCYSPAAWRRLAELRAHWDPDHVFHDFYARS